VASHHYQILIYKLWSELIIGLGGHGMVHVYALGGGGIEHFFALINT